MEIIYLAIGLILGAVLGTLASYFFFTKKTIKNKEAVKKQLKQLTNNLTELDKEKSVQYERLSNTKDNLKISYKKIENLEIDNNQLNLDLSKWKTNYSNLEEKLKNQKKELNQIQDKFKIEFENLANSIFEEKTKKLTSQNNLNLNTILNPFNEKLKDFGAKVQNTYEKGLKERSELQEQINHLSKLNLKMSEDAKNLTNALKHDTKAQGNWGEFILEKLLQESGLKEGLEYKKQHSTVNDDGKRIQPDIVIQMPENKHIIIDSKVSLIAYELFVSSDEKNEKEKHLKNHVSSVKNHIKGLGEKNYQSGLNLNSPDFVLLFMPIEPSFSLAIQNDNSLYQYAWDRKIVIVSPTTLLATLKTVSSIWKQEKQNKNILEITRQAGALYDKFVGFLNDMEKIEKSLNSASMAYNGAINKLKNGNGNLINSTEKLRKLGLKTKKQIPEQFLGDIDSIE